MLKIFEISYNFYYILFIFNLSSFYLSIVFSFFIINPINKFVSDINSQEAF